MGGAPTVTMQPGTLAAWPALREPHDRVHFAGTETATQWIGWVVVMMMMMIMMMMINFVTYRTRFAALAVKEIVKSFHSMLSGI